MTVIIKNSALEPFVLKKTITALTLSMSACANASTYFDQQPLELEYSVNCADSLCAFNSPLSYQAPSPFSMSLSEQQDLQIDQPLPRYLTVSSEKDAEYLRQQTYTILGLSVATVALMTLLPESVTKWDEEDRNLSGLGKKWKDNVSSGPVWDRDEHYLNYIMHPYFGGVYYTAARHAGYNEFQSFLYSFTMSAFFWEYGVEAFAEVPSYQDLFITPFFGAVVGEIMFETEQEIVANGGEVLGSETIGDIGLFFLNPVGHIHGWVSNAWGGSAELQLQTDPWYGNSDAANFALSSGVPYDDQFYSLNFKVTF